MLLTPDQARALFRCALEQHFAVLAVNADSPAAITDCLEAARLTDAPILVETSLWQLAGWSFGAGDAALGLIRYLADLTVLANHPRYAHLPVGFHTDHIKGPQTLPLLKSAIEGVCFGQTHLRLHASSISLDSSELTVEDNIRLILELARIADVAQVPVALEMEAGVDAGVTPVGVADELLGPVEQANPGKIALWAPGVGTQHGLSDRGYPFSPEAVAAHQARASQLCGRPIGIALHGSSGLPPEALRAGVTAGIVKVNWSSESLLLRSTAAQEFYKQHSTQLDRRHPDWKATAMDNGVQSHVSRTYVPKVMERIQILGGEGKASAVRQLLT